MTSADLLRLEERISIGLDAGESHFREFKSAIVRQVNGSTPRDVKALCQDVAEALVSFANADGGELLVGVEDDGTVTGVPHKESLVEAMKDAYRTNVHKDTPLSVPLISDVSLEDNRVLYFSVSKSLNQVHLTSNGRCLQRADRENRPVPAEQIQSDRAELASREYDRAFVDGATIADINLHLVETVSAQIAPGYSPEKLLQYLGLAEYGDAGLRYRKASLLLFAKDISRWHPRCSVRLVRVKGSELRVGDQYNVVQDEPVIGSVIELIEDAWNTLRPHLARTRFGSSGIFRESLIYPEAACREVLVNAIAHRDYSREGTPIEVFIFDDRIEFRSPGGLLSSVSLYKLASLKGLHDSRNVLIARTLRELGYMREMGEGIPRIFHAMSDFELVAPKLSSDRDSFTITLQHKSIFTQQDIEWLEGYKEFDLSKNEQRVVLLGKDGHLLSTNKILRVTGFVDIDDFRKLYELMRRKGLIYNAKPRLGGSGHRREIGRFQVRPPREVEQFFTELLEGLRQISPAPALTPQLIHSLRKKLSQRSPYAQRPDWSLQALDFVDAYRRFLPKGLAFVPELEGTSVDAPKEIQGKIMAVKSARYGFIRADDGTEYFFHQSGLRERIPWENLRRGNRVSFCVKPGRTSEEKDMAAGIRLR